ncbi:unnamed protein product [Acanthocheilonema viteae]|uniref:Uncharacterized protein n=1 Tax=Acanthocheilonema viteae TaxID=6277 RepID=A0A498S717_ACAVI|nr:unnamed protein product [Acanthocheilonema viteae]
MNIFDFADTQTTLLQRNVERKYHNRTRSNNDMGIGQIYMEPLFAQAINIPQTPICKVYMEKAWRGFTAQVRIHYRADTLKYPRMIHFNMPRDLLLIMESQRAAEFKNMYIRT